jgi:hypothetical protein
MNFGEILSRYEARTGATTTRANLAALIDEAQVEISKRFGDIRREEYYSAEKGEEYDLPADHLKTEEVKDENNRRRRDFRVAPDGKISFPVDGDYILIYTRVPDSIDKDDNNAEPDVHPIFHEMIVQYCAAKWWEDRSEGIPAEEAKSERMMREFYRKVDEAALVLRQRAFAVEPLEVHPIARGY